MGEPIAEGTRGPGNLLYDDVIPAKAGINPFCPCSLNSTALVFCKCLNSKGQTRREPATEGRASSSLQRWK